MALSGVAGAQKVIEAIWESNNMFARHHIAVKVGKLSVNCILDTLGPSQLTMVANRLNDSVKWAVKELELQGECWEMNKQIILDSIDFEIKLLTQFRKEDQQKVKESEQGGGYNGYYHGSGNALGHGIRALNALKEKIKMMEDK